MLRAFGTVISGNRGQNDELSNEQRSAVVAAVSSGTSKTEVARAFNVNRTTIYRTIERFKQQQSNESRHRPGAPKALTPRAVRGVIRTVRKEPRTSYNALQAQSQLPVHVSTLKRVIYCQGLKKYIAAKKPHLTPGVAKKRLAFATEMATFDWRNTLFSDECSVVPGSGKERSWVFRLPREKWRRNMLDTFYKSGRPGGHMVWGAIGYDTRSELVFMERCGPKNGYNSESYVLALGEGLQPMYTPGVAFQQDNAPIHKSGPAKDWFESRGVWVIDWPPYSPDMNPIEHVWWELKKQIHKKDPNLGAMGQSEAAVARFKVLMREAWNEVDQDFIRTLIDSMPRRLEAVRLARGWQTKY